MTNAALEHLVPRAHQMGVHFVEMRPGYVRAEVPFDGNGNHFGTVYAGVRDLDSFAPQGAQVVPVELGPRARDELPRAVDYPIHS